MDVQSECCWDWVLAGRVADLVGDAQAQCMHVESRIRVVDTGIRCVLQAVADAPSFACLPVQADAAGELEVPADVFVTERIFA